MEHTNRRPLFAASCVALIVTAMSFAIRGDIMGDLESQFSLDKTQLGWISGTAFWGFTLAMVFGGPLCDVVGMKRLVGLAFFGHLAGILVTIFANGFGMLFAGTLLIGIANGCVEAACNPLIATIYPDQKTKRLNQFHVWWPGGIVIGSLAVFALGKADIRWEYKMGTMLLPLIVYGVLFLPQRFPVTERVARGISTKSMFRECLRPLFIVMVLGMFLTASTELGPGQWIPNILTFTAGVSGILVLAWMSGLMMVGRQFAGPIINRLSPAGVLLGSAMTATAGIFLLSQASSVFGVFSSAAVFAIGVCYFWPTMLGFVAERLPKTGALGLSIMGGAGMLAVSLVLPSMGGIYDERTAEAVPEGYTVEELKQAEKDSDEEKIWEKAQAVGGASTLKVVTVLPAVLIVVFAGILIRDRMSAKDSRDPQAPDESSGASPPPV